MNSRQNDGVKNKVNTCKVLIALGARNIVYSARALRDLRNTYMLDSGQWTHVNYTQKNISYLANTIALFCIYYCFCFALEFAVFSSNRVDGISKITQ